MFPTIKHSKYLNFVQVLLSNTHPKIHILYIFNRLQLCYFTPPPPHTKKREREKRFGSVNSFYSSLRIGNIQFSLIIVSLVSILVSILWETRNLLCFFDKFVYISLKIWIVVTYTTCLNFTLKKD